MRADERILGWAILPLMLAACGGGGSSSASKSSIVSDSSQPATQSSASFSSSVQTSSSAQTVGISARPSNKTCLAPRPISTGDARINWSPVFPSLPVIRQATGLIQAPGDDSTWYALRQSGTVVRFPNDSTANQLETPLDIEDRVDFQDSETGLLGMAFHPQFATNRYVYFYYMGRNTSDKLESRVARYQFNASGTIDKNSELILLRFDQPFSNHNAGQLAFGPDGFLYIASGDGGSGGDPQQNGQDKRNLLGKILRIDVDRVADGKNYAIPADNPFLDDEDAREIWAYGLRNPWRFSFDKETGELWTGDVGQGAWEEINVITRGGNYGWGDMEGDSCYSGRPGCTTDNKITPVLSISHSTGVCSVIGGFVYRGADYPAIHGRYFYTDYCLKTMQSLTRSASGEATVTSHGSTPGNIISFAQDNNGELYALAQSGAGSQILRLQVTGGDVLPGAMPERLSATGCVDINQPSMPAAGLIPYSVESELWSDSADKERFMAIPDDKKIGLNTQGDFLFPRGSVLVKHFKLGEKYVETRLLTHSDTGWQGFSYEWRDDQTDAVLLNDAKEKLVGDIQWQFPSAAQCLVCHTAVANFALGPESQQLNASLQYPNGVVANQLDTLAHIQLFSTPPSDDQKARKLFALSDEGATLDQKARSYLHSNCAGCHAPDGPTATNLDLRFTTALSATNACNLAPRSGDLGISDARIIAPGEPERSVLLARMKRRDANQMPPLASHVVDEAAVNVVSEWIASLVACE